MASSHRDRKDVGEFERRTLLADILCSSQLTDGLAMVSEFLVSALVSAFRLSRLATVDFFGIGK